MKGRTLQPISISSLETSNWSTGPEWWLNSNDRVILMLHHTRAGLASTGEAERTEGFGLSSVTLLPSQKCLLPYLESHLLWKHHRQRDVSQLTWNNYKHLLLRSWETNTLRAIQAMCEGKCVYVCVWQRERGKLQTISLKRIIYLCLCFLCDTRCDKSKIIQIKAQRFHTLCTLCR